MAVTADDARHSVVGRARPIAQSALEAFLREETPRLPRGEFGTYTVQEVDVRTALTPCAMRGPPPGVWSLNPYTGCSHDCGYCYVPDVAHLERRRWGSYVVVKRNLPAVLARELRRRERKPVFLSSATDPYQPAEADHQITRRSLELLARADWPVHVLTRNPLVRRDVDLFARFREFSVGMSVPTLDDDLRRMLEPGAPSIEGRLRTLRRLRDDGFEPFANLMPCYPTVAEADPNAMARTFSDAGVRTVHAGGWRYVPSLEPFLRARLADAAEPFLAALRDPSYFPRMFERLEPAFRRRGVDLRWR